jgi:hypothetical protein
MGCDIHITAQRRTSEGWEDVTGSFAQGPAPFDWRSYGMYGFLADVRNYSAVPPISPPRGLPDDYTSPLDEYGGCELGDHSFSWLTVEELAAFDYDQPLEDRRVTRQTSANSWDGGRTAEPGGGEQTTYREFLGGAFFHDLEELKRVGAERIVFGFDS